MTRIPANQTHFTANTDQGATGMIRNVVFAVLLIAVVAVTGYATNGDNVTPLPGKDKSSASANPSYFEGIWIGSWTAYAGPSTVQDVTLRIDRGGKEGIFQVEYSWGAVEFRNRVIPAGTLKAKGREEGDRFIFKWKNKQGRDFEVTLQKYKDNVVKARMDKSGPLNTNERPYNETYLNRK